MVTLDGSFDGYNDMKLEGSFLGELLVSDDVVEGWATDGRSEKVGLGVNEGIFDGWEETFGLDTNEGIKLEDAYVITIGLDDGRNIGFLYGISYG